MKFSKGDFELRRYSCSLGMQTASQVFGISGRAGNIIVRSQERGDARDIGPG